ncbi:N-acetyltransferase [Methanofollis aquaemaris]|uniref:N-acetyltransferase n=1 Tax=Methanofollis aquaemaris TaxID=126734 RepID=A0A8A3S6J9_9EURY|nr:N-acetyltransferase [Methanofollis aquaemaris]QSZ67274.1 N-acetyltransferase [Methanofollis aquaemaris]
MIEYGRNRVGEGARIFDPVTLGFPSRDRMGNEDYLGTIIGRDAVLRSGTVIYCDVEIGDGFSTGHNVMIRERTKIGNHVAVGTATVIEGDSVIGDHVSLQSMVYIPTNTSIGDRVFIGPNAVLTNDRYPPRGQAPLQGPAIRDGVSIGAGAVLLPGITIGEGALVAAGSIVTHDVPEQMMAIGSPARFVDLPQGMRD